MNNTFHFISTLFIETLSKFPVKKIYEYLIRNVLYHSTILTKLNDNFGCFFLFILSFKVKYTLTAYGY